MPGLIGPHSFDSRCDDDRPDFRMISETRHVARRELPSRCCGPIKPGEEYIRFVFIEDGEFKSQKFHTRCWYGEPSPDTCDFID